jgi:hypothetical protein
MKKCILEVNEIDAGDDQDESGDRPKNQKICWISRRGQFSLDMGKQVDILEGLENIGEFIPGGDFLFWFQEPFKYLPCKKRSKTDKTD